MKQRIFSFLFGVVVLFTMFDITAYAKQNDMREIAYISKEIQKQDVQSTLNTISDSVESSSDFFYDGIRAVSIAKTHVDNDQNIYGSSTYQDRKKCTNGWLCAEFVATCVCEGGGLSRNYLSPSGSTFRENLLASGYCTEYVVRVRGDGYIHKADFTGVIAPGDVVFYKCPNYEGGKPYVHTVMFAGWRSDGLLQAYAHNGRNTGNAQYYKNCGYCNADISEAHILHFNKNNYTGNQLPQGVVDLIEGREGAIEILGWAFDRDDSSKSLTINVYVGGPAGVGKLYSVVADISRPDVVGAYPGVNEKCGFHNIVYVSERGEQEVYVYAVDANDSSKSTLLIEKTVTIRNIPFSIQFGQDTLVMERGDSTELSCSFKGDGIYSLAYLFSDPSIASLTKVTGVDWTTGVCTLHFEALTAGTTKFTFYLKDKEGNLLFNESMTITVKVPLTEETYVIKYDANGGSGAPAQQTKTYGSTLTLSSTKPTRTGYTFKNWNTKADGSGTSYAPGASYTGNAALTLYAQWTVDTYAVKYDANGGSGAPAQQTKTYGSTLTLSSTKPTRTGYTFKNWNTKADGSGTSYAPGASYTTNAALTLYAQWTVNTYAVKYDANGGSGAPAQQTKTYGSTLTLSSTKPTRTGYTFKNWNTKADGSGTSYASGTGYTGNAALTLYAQWTANTYAVKYDANGGSGAPAQQTKTYGSTLTLSSTKPSRTGYTFKNWNTKADGSGTSYASGASYTENVALTLYAQWTVNTYAVKYDANGGSGAPAQQTKTYGKTLTLSSTKPTRTGYTFKNWNIKADGSGTSYAPGTSYTGNAALTLYAQWTVNTYAVKYDANGGSGAPAQQTKTYGKTLTLSSTKPTRTGYTFKNWNIKADGSGTSYAPGTSYTGNAALTLYAQWEPLLKVSPISDITFTGREVKPEVVITDNGKVLKKGTDYTVVYKNNINVNTIKKVNEGIGSDFNENLPYVAVIGKGNYSGTIYINFNIVALPISDTSGNPTAGITLNLSENLVCNNTSAQTVFKSIRSTVAMREGQDFLLSLKTVSAKDATGKAVPSGTSLTENRIPTGYTGSFQLKIMGKGNYSGTITKNIYVQEKNHLLSTAIITLGSNLKTTTYTGSAIQLTPGYYDKVKKQHFIVKNNAVSTTVASANDVFTVKCGNEYLVAGRDYTISYSGNNSVGTATMTLTGNGEYSGTKSITFKVAGAQFNVSKVTVSGIVDKDYTGKPVTQSGLKLYYSIGNGKTKELISGQDYVVSYKNNTNKGTATVQFTGLASAGYTGSFSKTFKINAVSINDTAKVIRGSSMSNISISYAKGGAKPSGMVALTNVSGAKLVEGKDYKITYKNNKIIANTMAVAPPIMIIQGVGNYTGNISVPFSITQKAITSADIKVTVSQIQYNPKAKDSYVYMPSVKVTDQGVNMVRNVDYTMEYVKNTKADYDAYQKKVANGTAKIEDCPRVVVRAKAGGNYTGTDALVIELPIYPTKIKNTNVKIIITEMTYSGMQLTPKVAVYYNDDSKAMQRAKYITNENELLALGFVKLTANTDYVLEYGTNIVSGRNKGKVTIIGTGKTFGGKITGSFTINAKELKIIE